LDRLARVLTMLLAAAEPSKVPFYIAGSALTAWAVALAWLGLTRPSFPFHDRGARGVMGITFVLFAVAVAMAIVTSK
jgi:hypothetical protein